LSTECFAYYLKILTLIAHDHLLVRLGLAVLSQFVPRLKGDGAVAAGGRWSRLIALIRARSVAGARLVFSCRELHGRQQIVGLVETCDGTGHRAAAAS